MSIESPFLPSYLGAPCAVPEGHCPAYYALPASIQELYTHEQWNWLSDNEKGTLEQRETEPEEES